MPGESRGLLFGESHIEPHEGGFDSYPNPCNVIKAYIGVRIHRIVLDGCKVKACEHRRDKRRTLQLKGRRLVHDVSYCILACINIRSRLAKNTLKMKKKLMVAKVTLTEIYF